MQTLFRFEKKRKRQESYAKVPKIQVSLKGVPFLTRGIGGRKLG